MSAAERRLKAFGNSVQSLGKSFVNLGTAAAVPFAASSRTFADFESAMARVKALTNASGEEFAQLGALAKKLGADTIFSAAQAAQAMGNFAQAGFKVNEIMQAVGPTLDLAATAQIEIADAAKIAASVMRGMGIEARDLAGVVDVLAKAATTANTDITQLGDAFKFVGPVAKTAGISFEEITGAIQILSDAGIQGEMAGTSLRGMILSLVTPSDEAAKELARLGISVTDARGNFRSLTSIFAQFERALSGMGSGQKLEALGTIFPDRQAAGAAVIAAEGAERLAAATAALGNSAGEASRVAGVQMDTLRGTVDILMSSVEGVGIEIGEALTPTLREWGKSMAAIANTIAGVIKANKPLIASIGKAVAATVGVGAAMFGTGLAIRLAGAGIGVLGKSIGLLLLPLKALTLSFNAAGIAARAFAATKVALGALLSPSGLLVGGLVAAGVAFFKYTDAGQQALGKMGELFMGLKSDAVEAFGGIADALKSGNIELAGKVAMAGLRLTWQRGLLVLSELWADWGVSIVEGFRSVSFQISRIITDIWSGAQKAWAIGVDALEGVWFEFLSATGQTEFGVHEASPAFGKGVTTGAGIGAVAELTRPKASVTPQTPLEKELARIEAERQGAQSAITDMQETEAAARRAEAAAGIEQAKKDLDAAVAEFKGLRQQAAGVNPLGVLGGAVAGLGVPGAAAEGGAGGSLAKKIAEGFTPEGLDQALQATAKKVDVTGSFSAAALRGIGVGTSVADRQLEEQKEATKELKELNKKARAGRLVFTA